MGVVVFCIVPYIWHAVAMPRIGREAHFQEAQDETIGVINVLASHCIMRQ